MSDTNRTLVFLDISIDGDPSRMMVFQLFTDLAPATAENFRALCTACSVVDVFAIFQGGDFRRTNGKHGESIYGKDKFPDEAPAVSHNRAGLLSMANSDRPDRGSLFSITLAENRRLDSKNICFGRLVEGVEVLERISEIGAENKGKHKGFVKIIDSGQLNNDKKRSIQVADDAPEVNEPNKRQKSLALILSAAEAKPLASISPEMIYADSSAEAEPVASISPERISADSSALTPPEARNSEQSSAGHQLPTASSVYNSFIESMSSVDEEK